MMGAIRGAMIMAPIIVGALFAMRPNVAIAEARPSIRKNPNDGTEAPNIWFDRSSAEIGFSKYGAQPPESLFVVIQT